MHVKIVISKKSFKNSENHDLGLIKSSFFVLMPNYFLSYKLLFIIYKVITYSLCVYPNIFTRQCHSPLFNVHSLSLFIFFSPSSLPTNRFVHTSSLKLLRLCVLIADPHQPHNREQFIIVVWRGCTHIGRHSLLYCLCVYFVCFIGVIK